MNTDPQSSIAAVDVKMATLLAGKKKLSGIVAHVFGSIDPDERRLHRKAIVVGTPDVVKKAIGRICVHSAQRMNELLGQQFKTVLIDDEISLRDKTGTGQEAYSKRVRKAIDGFFASSTSDDTLVFYYSGHGARDPQSKELTLSMGAGDAYPVAELLDFARSHQYRSFVLILDCCFSGSIGDSVIEGTFRQIPRNMCIITAGLPRKEVYAISRDVSLAGLRQSHWMLSDKFHADSTRDYRKVDDVKDQYTYFSHYLIEALCGGAANPMGIVTLTNVYKYVSEALGTNVTGELHQVDATLDDRTRPMMKGYLEHDVPLCFVGGILHEEDLDNILTFRNNLFDRTFNDTLQSSFGETDEETRQVELRKMPIPFMSGADNQHSLRRLLLLGLIKPMGKNFYRKQLVDVYKFTPRGWHYWEMLQQVLPQQNEQPADTAPAEPSAPSREYQQVIDKIFRLVKPLASGAKKN